MTSNLRRVNLLPPEVGAERSQTKVRVIVIVANVALIAILGLLYVMKVGEVGAANSDLKAQQAKNEGVRSQINDPALQQVVQKDAERTARVQMVSTALGGEMSFPRFLNEISLMLPKGVWLTSLSIDSGAAAGAPAGNASSGAQAPAPTPAADSSGTSGTFQVEAKGKCGHDDAAEWLDRMHALPSVSEVWVSTSAKDPGTPCEVATFSSDGSFSPTIQTLRSQVLAQGRLP
ncbi:MAG: hypothetical protein K1X95_06730 [Acidimicrobiia bacterium]|nr:hypothetical protein [Acidimicrobiia bacterium]